MRIGSIIASGLFAMSIAFAGCIAADPSETDDDLGDEESQAADDDSAGEASIEQYGGDPKLPAGCGRVGSVCCASWGQDGHCTAFGTNYIYVPMKPGAHCPAPSQCNASSGSGEQP